VIDHLRLETPTIGFRLRVYETGAPYPDMSSVAAVVFLLGDPLEELYPECHADAMRVYEDAQRRGLAVVNPPTVLGRYRKRDQAARWSALGLPTPPGGAYDNFDGLQSVLANADYPLLLRADADHCMTDIVRVKDRSSAGRLTSSDVPLPGIATPWVDVRRGYPTTGPDRIWGTLYHKMRVYVWGDEVVPDSLYFSRMPTVSLEASMFHQLWEREQWARRYLRIRPMRRAWSRLIQRRCWVPDIYEREIEFCRAPVANEKVFKDAAEALGLGFVAFDYSTLADGTPMLWEANPYPDIGRLDKGLKGTPRRKSEIASIQLRGLARFFWKLSVTPAIDRPDWRGWALPATARHLRRVAVSRGNRPRARSPGSPS
jgi:hypothetical protein